MKKTGKQLLQVDFMVRLLQNFERRIFFNLKPFIILTVLHRSV